MIIKKLLTKFFKKGISSVIFLLKQKIIIVFAVMEFFLTAQISKKLSIINQNHESTL